MREVTDNVARTWCPDDGIPHLNFGDNARFKVSSQARLMRLSFSVPDGACRRRNSVADSLHVGDDDLFLIAFGILLSRHSGRYSVPIGVLNTLRDAAVLFELENDPDIAALAAAVSCLAEHDMADSAAVSQSLDTPNCYYCHSTLPAIPDDLDADLALHVEQSPGVVTLNFRYAGDRFAEDRIRTFAAHFFQVLDEISSRPGIRISGIRMITPEEEYQVLTAFNDTAVDYPRDVVLHTLFEQQAQDRPESIALVCGDLEMPYAVLDEQSNSLARTLRNRGVKPDDIVGLMTERSTDMVVGLLGILKAGGAYLPLDPGFPADRIAYMLEDSGAGILLTQRQLRDAVDFDGIVIDLQDESNFDQDSKPLQPVSAPDDLAYVIYTSGSTGKPKGVQIQHINAVNFLWSMAVAPGLCKSDLLLSVTTLSFDIHVLEIFLPLIRGATVVVASRDQCLDGDALIERIETRGITLMQATPATWRLLLDAGWQGAKHMKILCGGEPMKPGLALELLPRCSELWNMYGPTETTVWSTVSRIVDGDITVGKPIANTEVLVLDSHMRPVPPGVTGELLIAGDGLARGYLNRPELTAEKFIDHPFKPGAKIYRTGDLARWRHDGNLECLGRIDHQVKIRGYRIELGEIESRLLAYDSILENAVVDREAPDGSRYLCAYYISDSPASSAALRAFLLESLPDYMVPSYFVRLGELPLTPNRKIDRNALPEPLGLIGTSTPRREPETDTERRLFAIWASILGVNAKVVGTEHSFFDLGGHSLLAGRLLSRVHCEFDVRLTLRTLFEDRTIRRQAARIDHAQAEEAYSRPVPTAHRPFYQLTPAENRQFVLYEMDIADTSYNLPLAFFVNGVPDFDRLGFAVQALLDRHESLRAYFEVVDGQPVKKFHDKLPFHIRRITAPEAELESIISAFVRSFDLEKGPVARMTIATFSAARHLILIDMHHIVADGVSIDIILRDFAACYNGAMLEPLPLQFRDYSAWVASQYATAAFARTQAFWLQQFDGAASLPLLNLPTDFPRPAIRSSAGDRVVVKTGRELAGKLEAFSAEKQSTLYITLFTIYVILLGRYSRQSDLVVGTVAAGRPDSALDDIVGMFVNTLALRVQLQSDQTFTDLLESMRSYCLDAFDNQHYPFDFLVEKVVKHRDPSRNPLFDTMFVLENTGENGFALDGLEVSPRSFPVSTSQFDITLEVLAAAQGLRLTFEYATSLFLRSTIERFADSFVRLAERLMLAPDTVLGDIRLMSDDECALVLKQFTPPPSPYADDGTLDGLFELAVARTPDHAALRYRHSSITYCKVNERAGRLARHLRDLGVTAETSVAILIERSPEMCVAILAVLKAGGAYVPVDPDYPPDRIRYIIDDSGAKVLISQQHLRSDVGYGGVVVDIDDPANYVPSHGPSRLHGPQNLAYIIYTSGSTGKPKGVMITHRNAVNILTWFSSKYHVGPECNALQMTNFSFDVSVEEILGTLLQNGTLVIGDKGELLDPYRFRSFLRRHYISLAQFVPVTLRELLIAEDDRVACLDTVICGGEKLESDLKNRALDLGYRLFNHYGPTEATVDALCQDCDYVSDSIGQPVGNTQVQILDSRIRLSPVGLPGELCIAGDGLARGYLNRPDLSAERFIPNPYATSARIYRTGDLARWLSDGAVAFMGRLDFQVKIRGHRIELGEIEAALRLFDDVVDAVVINHDDGRGDHMLCGYVIVTDESVVTELKNRLSSELPPYMVPAVVIAIDQLPLTPNGKVDRRALPDPTAYVDDTSAWRPPETPAQIQLAAIWAEILGAEPERIGRTSNFFELGGHSLLAIRFIAHVHRDFDTRLTLSDIFQHPTIENLAALIDGREHAVYHALTPIAKMEHYPLSSAEKRLFVLYQFNADDLSYNMPLAFRIEGVLNIPRLERAFQCLVQRHDALRTAFRMIDGKPVRVVLPEARIEIERLSANDIELVDIKATGIRPFDLGTAPILRVTLVSLAPRVNVLLIDSHHIVVDGISIEIMFDDLRSLYDEEPLAPLTLQYRDYAVWQNRGQGHDRFRAQEAYWLKRFEGEITALNLMTDFTRPPIRDYAGDVVSYVLSDDECSGLESLAAQHGATLYMTLLSAYVYLLSQYSQETDIVVGTVASGRPQAELESIMGMFVSTLALRFHLDLEMRFDELLEAVRDHTLEAFENQEYPFESLVERLALPRDLSRNPIFDTMFVHNNIRESDLTLTGLDVTPQDFAHKVSQFDLTLEAQSTNSGLKLSFEYAVALYTRQTIHRIAGHYVQILREILAKPNIRLADIQMITRADRIQILQEFNDLGTVVPQHKTVKQLFEDQARDYPDNIAIVHDDRILSFGRLNRMANQLASRLIAVGVEAESIVALMIEPSFDMIAGMLAILKAGGAYLPIDPANPPDRVDFILRDSQAEVLISRPRFCRKIDFSGRIISAEDPAVFTGPGRDRPCRNGPKNLAYSIYTSGSTGMPKGVMIEHRNAVNVLSWFGRKYSLDHRCVTLQFTNFSFDVSVEEIFGTLLFGGRLVIPHFDLSEPDRFRRLIDRRRVSIIQFSPVTLRVILDGHPRIASLGVIICGGEKLDPKLKNRILDLGYALYDHYGPTETTVDALSTRCTPESEAIGKPIANTQIYIINRDDMLQPIGVPGELCISGFGLARGYLGRPDLTAEKFVPNDFRPGNRLYKTGDLVRWLSNGKIEYLSRIDNQVKIRGIRIELEEIETKLLNHPQIMEVTVQVCTGADENQFLCAYFVADATVARNELHAFLNEQLPEYMLPSSFVQIDEMPLTAGGKINRKALPEPGRIDAGLAAFEPPETDVEKRLAAIWSDLLGQEYDSIGANVSFFQIGGHSLSAVQLISRMHREFDCQLSLTDVFSDRTVAALANRIANSQQVAFAGLTKRRDRCGVYPLSYAENRQFVLSRLDGGDAAYNIPVAFRLCGVLDMEGLRTAFANLVARHDAFRSRFLLIDGEPMKQVDTEASFAVDFVDAAGSDPSQVFADFVKPFDIGTPPLLRVQVAALADDDVLLLIDMHHIISDGVSLAIFLAELGALYGGDTPGPAPFQYCDFEQWQRDRLSGGELERQERYWLEHLAGEIPVLNLPLDFPRPPSQCYGGDTIEVTVPASTVDALEACAAKSDSTLFMTLLAAYNCLLFHYCRQEDIIVGSVVAGRGHSDVQNIIGMFVNTLALRNYPAPDKTFATFLEEVRRHCIDAFDNQDYPFELLVEKLAVKRDLSRNPLFDTLFVVQNMDDATLELPGLHCEEVAFPESVSKFDLSVEVTITDDGLTLTFEYVTRLFEASTIKRLAAHYVEIIGAVTADPYIPIGEIGMITDEESTQVLERFNATHTAYETNGLIHRLFEEQVRQRPEETALVCSGRELSYADLDRLANRLARQLRKRGVGCNGIVGVLVERSPEMVASVLAVLKAGCAYLPLDPIYPHERIAYMLEDSGAAVLLSQSGLAEKLAFEGAVIDVFDPALNGVDDTCPDVGIGSADLAYVIYTSGSTGKPKGVEITHRNAVNFLRSMAQQPGLRAGDHLLSVTTLSFDIHVLELFLPLLEGGAVVLATREESLDGRRLIALLGEWNVAVMQATPATWRLLADSDWAGAPALKILCGGEPMKPDLAEWLIPRCDQLWNMYGPTETTVWSTVYHVQSHTDILIGKPIGNTCVYILNDAMLPVPPGIVGELYIGGDGVARGYHDRPELTAERFLDNPFRSGERFYRTGDLARWRPDGNIECLGRVDHQVKIRGFRIELGEIEARILRDARIGEAAVIDREDSDGSRFLCAYYTAKDDIAGDDFKTRLAVELPDYMIPLFFVRLDSLPLTPNGKIDRKALPEPDLDVVDDMPIEPPGNDAERTLIQIWSDVLGIDGERIGVLHNFFNLGGQSLRAVQLVYRIQQAFDVDLALSDVFNGKTVRALADRIAALDRHAYTALVHIPDQDDYSLSSAEKRQFILNRFDETATSYNITQAFDVKGPLDRERLQDALTALVQRHEAFRSSFAIRDGGPVKRIASSAAILLDYVATAADRLDHDISTFIRPFDLGKSPLLRACLLGISATEHVFLIDMHHIIADGVSLDIIMHDIAAAYKGRVMEPLSIQYRDFASWQGGLVDSPAYTRQEQYWLSQFEDDIPVLELPLDKARPAAQDFSGGIVSTRLDAEIVSGLEAVAAEHDATMFMTVLAAYICLLHKYTGQQDIVVGTVAAGRSHADLDEVIGMFVNTLPIRTGMSADMSFIKLLADVRTRCVAALEHQDYPFENLVEKLPVERDVSRNPVFDTLFLYQDNTGSGFELSGLTICPRDFDDHNAKFDITFVADRIGDGLVVTFEYAQALFRRATIERMAAHFRTLLASILSDPGRRLSAVSVLGQDERTNAVTSWNDTTAEQSNERYNAALGVQPSCVHGVIAHQAKQTPDAVAVVHEGACLSYEGLTRCSNRVAAELIAAGVVPETPIAVYVDRSIEMIVAVLGVMKAGCAYVPLDPAFPENRIRFMMEDAGIRVVLTTADRAGSLPFAAATSDMSLHKSATAPSPTVLVLDEIMQRNGACKPSPAVVAIDERNPAYIIYTSGSTGRSKGVVIEHRQLMHYITGIIARVDFVPGSRFATVSTLAADLGNTVVFPSLCTGGELHVLSWDRATDAGAFNAYVARTAIDYLKIVPSHFAALQDPSCPDAALPAEALIVGGEAAAPDWMQRILTANRRTDIINHYGPTETTVGVLTCDARDVAPSLYGDPVPLGRPLKGTTVYVVDNGLEPVPIGVAGEIVIGGPAVARGYLRRPDLTAERFIPDPFPAHGSGGSRLYRTGDSARYRGDGRVVYRGRIDQQVKIRGYRIELGEIVDRLLQHEAVREGVVRDLSDIDGEKYLCAWYVADRALDDEVLRTFLTAELPEYMVPRFMVHLVALPLTPNGKLDSRALPLPDVTQAEAEIEPPATTTEGDMIDIWAEVLGISPDGIGVQHSFFQLGGQSLKAIQLGSRIHQRFGVRLSLNAIFEARTIRGIGRLVDTADSAAFIDLEPAPKAVHYQLSAAETRQYILNQFSVGDCVYNMPMAFQLDGDLDVAALERACARLVERHDAFRSAFMLVEDVPVKVIADQLEFTFDLTTIDATEVSESINAFVRPFDLAAAPLLRFELLRVSALRHVFLLDMHHIISDGVSLDIIFNELRQLYAGANLEPLRYQYKDFAHWQQAVLASNVYAGHESFWLERFQGELPVLNLPLDFPRPAVQRFDGDDVSITVNPALLAGLEALASEYDATLFIVLLAVYSCLLSRYGDQEDIVVGTAVAGRPLAELNSIVGMFVNTLALRNMPAAEKPFAAFLAEVREHTLAAFDHQDYPFESLVDNVTVARDLARNPLFDTMFILQTAREQEIDFPGVAVSRLEFGSITAKLDLLVEAEVAETGLEVTFTYATTLFRRDTITRLAGHFEQLIRSVVREPQIGIGSISLLDPSEYNRIMHAFNDTVVDYPCDGMIHLEIEKQAAVTPGNVAVVFEGHRLTYDALNERVNRLADYLRGDGIGCNAVVAICLERSIDLVVAILGILKAGGGYLPIDPEYPEHRVNYVLEDSDAAMLISDSRFIGRYAYDGAVVDLQTLDLSGCSPANPPPVNQPDDIAYVIYTSGSTGNPKGAMIPHTAIFNHMCWMFREYPVDQSDAVFQKTPYSFDASVWEFYAPLMRGGRLVVSREGGHKDMDYLARTMIAENVTIFQAVPSLLSSLLYHPDAGKLPLKRAFCGGEPLAAELVGRFYALLDCPLINLYGPTEVTIDSTHYVCPRSPYLGVSSIGKPVDNLQVYILDRRLQPCPIGVTGELYISGRGLALGYRNRPELTAERFIDNPFIPGSKMYKSGDLVKWMPDGNIAFSGRIDHQVKIRGFRIECGEIESCIKAVDEMSEAAVIDLADSNGDKFLCCYFVASRQFIPAELREVCAADLPDYMIPSFFVQLAAMPLTPNGKLDRKALPEPLSAATTGTSYVAPRNDVETALVEIWSDVLDVPSESIGVHHSFFDLGGHSLKAVQIVARMFRHFEVRLTLNEIFEDKHIEALAQRIMTADSASSRKLDRMANSDHYELSSAERLQYRCYLDDKDAPPYNITLSYIIAGALDRKRLTVALQSWVDRHEAFRSSFHVVDGETVKKVAQSCVLEPVWRRAEGEAIDDLIRDFIRPFRLDAAPLLRAEIVQLGDDSHLLMMDMHHIISDGVSVRILMRELGAAYDGKALPEPAVRYRDFAHWQNQCLHGDEWQTHEAYWQGQFSGEVPVLQLPLDRPRPAVRSYHGEAVHVTINAADTAALTALARAHDATMFMTLLTCYACLLHKHTKQDDIVVGSVVAGRTHPQVDDVVGMFVNTLALRIQPKAELPIATLLTQVKTCCANAFRYQQYPFQNLVDRVAGGREPGRNPLFDTTFEVKISGETPLDLQGLVVTDYHYDKHISGYDLSLDAEIRNDTIACTFEYDATLFSKSSISRMADSFVRIVQFVSVRPAVTIGAIDPPSDKDQRFPVE